MDHTELGLLLELLTPNIVDVDGRLLLQSTVDLPKPITTSAQRQHNCLFIVADLLDDVLDPPTVGSAAEGSATLIARVANLYANALRGRLAEEFPSHSVTVDVTGAEAVDDEPLEVEVTFYQEGERAPPTQ